MNSDDEVYDAEMICQRINNETGSGLDSDQWLRLLDSAAIHTLLLNKPTLRAET
jgi:hypothetical protein